MTPWTVAHQAPQSMGFSRQECWNGSPFSSPGDLPKPGIKPGYPELQADSLQFEPPVCPSNYSRMRQRWRWRVSPKACGSLWKMCLVSLDFSGSTTNRWNGDLWNCDGCSLAGVSRMHLPLVGIFGRKVHTAQPEKWIHILYMWNDLKSCRSFRGENNTKFHGFQITQFSCILILVPNCYFLSHV